MGFGAGGSFLRFAIISSSSVLSASIVAYGGYNGHDGSAYFVSSVAVGYGLLFSQSYESIQRKIPMVFKVLGRDMRNEFVSFVRGVLYV